MAIIKFPQSLTKIINDSFRLENTIQKQFADTIAMNEALVNSLSAFDKLDITFKIPEFRPRIPELGISSITDALDASDKIIEIVQPIVDWEDKFANQLRSITEGLNPITQQLTASFAALDLSFSVLPTDDIFKDLLEVIQDSEDTEEAFKAAKWAFSPSMSSELKQRVIDLYKQGRTRYVSSVILGYYRRNNYAKLKDTVDNWHDHPLFAPRMHIINDALKAHCNKLYTLSVPTLLPQIEGILNDYVTTNNLSAKPGKIKKVYETVIGDLEGDGGLEDYGILDWAIASTLLYQLQTITYTFTNFERELQRSSQGRQVSRHTVLHGIATNYHKPIHSLKIFILLDAISMLRDL